jgi:cholesterol oxidase
MGRSAADGTVDSYGEVFGNPGLFVVDGAIMPGPVGANPSLTIAAFADRAAQAILDGRTARVARRRGAAPRVPVPVPDPATAVPAGSGNATAGGSPVPPGGLEFAVHMKGFVGLDMVDPQDGARQGREDDARISAHLRMRLDDVTRFAVDPVHSGRAGGSLNCDVLGGQLFVEGTVHLNVAGTPAGPLRDEYRLFFADGVGHPLTLVGSKPLRADVQFGPSPQTSQLTFRILAGHSEPEQEPSARVVGSGVMSIDLLDLARQLASYRIGTADPARMAVTAARFGAFFAEGLWRECRPALARTPDAEEPESAANRTGAKS